jgi:plastocyanin domain-containing protein
MSRYPRNSQMKRFQIIMRGSLLVGIGLSISAAVGLFISGCANKPVAAVMGPDGVQTAKVMVRHGYHPNAIEAKAGQPLKVEFYRDEETSESCDKVLMIPAENVSIPLPIHERQIVEIKPHAAGEIEFQCGMKMMKGKITFR